MSRFEIQRRLLKSKEGFEIQVKKDFEMHVKTNFEIQRRLLKSKESDIFLI
jgi:hypothetical protein